MNNIELFEQTTYSVTLSQKYLYRAIDSLQELALYTVGGSSNAIHEINELASEIGDIAEQMIAETALKQGVRFRPKYIKDIPPETPLEVVKIAIPSQGPWKQASDTGLWTENADEGWIDIDTKTVNTGPWTSPVEEVQAPLKNPRWVQFVPTPFISTAHWISRVVLPKSA